MLEKGPWGSREIIIREVRDGEKADHDEDLVNWGGR